MADLIDRAALLEKLDALSEIFRRRGENEDKGFLAVQCGVTFAVGEVNDAATVDAVEVVRCEDCRFAQPISDHAARAFNAELVRDCTYQRGDWKMVYGFSVVSADGYCDEGERRKEQDDG